MSKPKKSIQELISSIAARNGSPIEPASDDRIDHFRRRAREAGVPEAVVEELVGLYRVADAFSHEIILGFFPCDDPVIFEWWSENELWLGQKDLHSIRWVEGQFCLGDAGNRSFSPDHECPTLASFLSMILSEIEEAEAVI